MSDELVQLVRELSDKVDTVLQRLSAIERQLGAESASAGNAAETGSAQPRREPFAGEAREEPRLHTLELLPPPEPRAVTVVRAEDKPSGEPSQVFLDDIPNPRYKTPRELLIALFSAATNADEYQGFLTFLGCMGAGSSTSRLAIAQMRAFNWKQLRTNAPLYLTENKPDSFIFARSEPPEPDESIAKIKFFIHSDHRNAAPVTVKRDAGAENSWRIMFCSL